MTKATGDFSRLSQELDTILSEIQSAEVDIDEAVKKYERALEIIAEQGKYLDNIESKINKIKLDRDKKSS